MKDDNLKTNGMESTKDDELELCESLENAIRGGIPRDKLSNHGKHSTESSEIESRGRFDRYLDTDLSQYIDTL